MKQAPSRSQYYRVANMAGRHDLPRGSTVSKSFGLLWFALVLACTLVDLSAGLSDVSGGCVCVWGRVQRKMAKLASKKGASAGGDDAAAKKAAFLKEAEEAVRRAAQTEADRKSADKNTEVVPPPSTRVCVCQKSSIFVFIPAEMRHAIDAQMPLHTPEP